MRWMRLPTTQECVSCAGCLRSLYRVLLELHPHTSTLNIKIISYLATRPPQFSLCSTRPDPLDLYGALLWLPGKRDTAPDVRGINGENATVVSLENNAAVPLLFAALADRAGAGHSYMECLQVRVPLFHLSCRWRQW